MADSFNISMYVGYSEEKLLSLRQEIEDSTDADGLVISTSTKDMSVQYSSSDAAPYQKMQAILYALWKLDPSTYAKPEVVKVRRYYTT